MPRPSLISSSMLRPNATSARIKPFKMAFAGALALAFAISCTDSTGPSLRFPDSVKSVYEYVPDSLKGYWLDAGSASLSISGDVTVAPGGAALSASAAGWKYSVSHPKFDPEEYPRIVVPRESWIDPLKPTADADGVIQDVPLGFEFNFYGNTYDKVNVYANGFLGFGAVQKDPFRTGFFKGDAIPFSGLPNNIIAFAWTDWSPQRVEGGVSFETRGSAPNRRFLLQFNNVPEYSSNGAGTGLLMMQLVLEESTNTITIYTNTLKITPAFGQRITQGIENIDGTAAAFDSILNPNNGITSPRVRNMFSLSDDAVRFAPPRPPSVTAPASISVPTTAAAEGVVPAIGQCIATVDPGVATATDDIGVVSLVGVRSDDPSLALNAPYGKGVTTITWTATDTDGMETSATQTVTVADKENPFLFAPGNLEANNDPHLPSAVVAVGSAEAKDNCDDVSPSGSRSDGADLSAPFMVGVTRITWTVKDLSGNSSSAVQSVTVFDKEAPSITMPPDIAIPAIGPNGAPVPFEPTVDDNVAVVSVVCSHAPGSVFPITTTQVECTASDAAGNKASGVFQVTVFDAPTQMQTLIEYLLAQHLPDGTTDPLLDQLQAALSGFGSDTHVSCVKMRDFLKLLETKRRDIPSTPATWMTVEADRIISVLACSPAPGRPNGTGLLNN